MIDSSPMFGRKSYDDIINEHSPYRDMVDPTQKRQPMAFSQSTLDVSSFTTDEHSPSVLRQEEVMNSFREFFDALIKREAANRKKEVFSKDLFHGQKVSFEMDRRNNGITYKSQKSFILSVDDIYVIQAIFHEIPTLTKLTVYLDHIKKSFICGDEFIKIKATTLEMHESKFGQRKVSRIFWLR